MAEGPTAARVDRVLVLHSYHPGFLWSDEITRGIRSVFDGTDVQVHVQYMDTKHLRPSKEHLDLIEKLLSLKAQKYDYDVVLTCDNNAFQFMKKRGRRIFGDVPHVFCGVNYLNRADLRGLINATGVNEEADIEGNLSLISQLHPGSRRVLVIIDGTPTGKQIRREVERIKSEDLFPDLKLDVLTDVSTEQLKTRLAALSPPDVVLLTVFFRDNQNNYLTYDAQAKMVSRHAAVPVYGCWSFSLGFGILGGDLAMGFDQGETAAKKAMRILEGTSVAEVPVMYRTPTRPTFDFEKMQEFGISMSQLPPTAEVVGRPTSFYEKYKGLVWQVAGVIVFLVGALGVVAVFYVRARAAEADARRSEKDLHTTLHSIGDGVIATDIDGQVSRMNEVAENLTGWPVGEARGEELSDVFQIVDAQTGAEVENPVDQVLQNGETVGLANHTQLNSRDGAQYQIADSAAPIRDAENELRGVVLVFRDITDQYHLRNELEQQRRRLELVIEAANLGTWDWDVASGRVDFNANWAEMLGYEVDELEPGYETWEGLVHPDDLDAVRDELEAHLVGETDFYEAEFRMQHKSGSWVWVLDRGKVIERDEKGDPIRMCGTHQDITARKRYEDERRKMQKLDGLGKVAGGIAHDFNNLLTGVFGNVELAQKKLTEDHEAFHYLTRAHRAMEEARNLTNQLLTFAKGGDPILETVDIGEHLKETIEFNLSGSEVRPRFDLPEDLWPVHVDRGQIDQVLANLTINAREAMPTGGTLSVRAENVGEVGGTGMAGARGKFVKIEIVDEGIGIPEKFEDKIFDPYFSTKQTGSGLGLSVVHSVIDQHDGHITIDSKPGEGTKCTIYLPADPDSDELLDSGAEPAPETSDERSRVLLMDDEQMVREFGKEMLSQCGHSVRLACDGEEAVDQYIEAQEEGDPFDVVILDLTVPGGMGGQEAVKRLLEFDPDARVIVSSGYSSGAIFANYADYGFAGRLAKPYRETQLRDEISRVLEEQAGD